MRKTLLVLLALTLCVSVSHAKRKSDKAGKVTDQVFTDKQYDFSFSINKEWKHSIKANKLNYRIILTQKNYEIPPDYMDAPDYTQIPKLVVWVDTTSYSASAFIDSLVSEKYKSDQKKDIFREFDVLNPSSASSGTYRENLISKGKRTFSLADEKAIRWTGSVAYMKEVALSASSKSGKRVRGAYGGTIVGVKHGDMIILFHMICEWVYHPQIESEIMAMINSLKWVEPGESKEK